VLEFVARRLLHAALVTVGVVTLVFVALRMSGDPAASMLPGDASIDELRDLRRALGLDRPLATQYLAFLGSAPRGDFGEFFRHQQPAFGLVLDRLPATLELAFAALLLAVVVALPLPSNRRQFLALAGAGALADAQPLGAQGPSRS
jgi:peptide/nickel transport system permease protein